MAKHTISIDCDVPPEKVPALLDALADAVEQVGKFSGMIAAPDGDRIDHARPVPHRPGMVARKIARRRSRSKAGI